MGSIGNSTGSAGGSSVTQKVDTVNNEVQVKANNMTATQLNNYVKTHKLTTAFNRRWNTTSNRSFENRNKIMRDLVMDDLRNRALKRNK